MSHPMRVVIVDDELPARDLLRSMLEAEPDVVVVGEAADGDGAIEQIAACRPELLMLDIHMPGRDGFDVIEAVGARAMPHVIFMSAYDRYALRAFDVHALDYILKPYDQLRLSRAIQHAATRVRACTPDDLETRLAALVEHVQSRRAYPQRVGVRTDGRTIFIDTRDIDYIQAADKVLRVHVGKATHTMRITMGAMESQLDPAAFVRVHRSTIVNVARVREIQPWFRNDYVLILHNGARLMSGRMYRHAVRAMLNAVIR
jgi:two-component system LytT family response regulator